MSPRDSKLVEDDDLVDDLVDDLEDLGAEEAPTFEEEAPAPKKRGAKGAKKAKPGIVLEKPRANVYTVLLILTFVALVVGCGFLYAELNLYEWKVKVR